MFVIHMKIFFSFQLHTSPSSFSQEYSKLKAGRGGGDCTFFIHFL